LLHFGALGGDRVDSVEGVSRSIFFPGFFYSGHYACQTSNTAGSMGEVVIKVSGGARTPRYVDL